MLSSRLSVSFLLFYFLFSTLPRPPWSTLFPYTTLFRSVCAFLDRFGPFLAQDARHDIWLRSHSDDATVVLDRHKDRKSTRLNSSYTVTLYGVCCLKRKIPQVPAHMHYYNRSWDDSEREI